MSKSFDNGMVCASEQAVIIDKEVYDEFVEEFKSYHTYFVNKKEKALLEEFCFGAKSNSKNCAGAKLNADIVEMCIRDRYYLQVQRLKKQSKKDWKN